MVTARLCSVRRMAWVCALLLLTSAAATAAPATDVVTTITGEKIVGGLFATGGVERVTTDLTATLTLPNGGTIDGRTKPGLWDPMIGAAWRSDVGNHLHVELAFNGGGFGVGTDVHLVGDAAVDWRIAGPLQLRFGWDSLYYKLTVAEVSIGAFNRELVSSQTLHGPVVGIGLIF